MATGSCFAPAVRTNITPTRDRRSIAETTPVPLTRRASAGDVPAVVAICETSTAVFADSRTRRGHAEEANLAASNSSGLSLLIGRTDQGRRIATKRIVPTTTSTVLRVVARLSDVT